MSKIVDKQNHENLIISAYAWLDVAKSRAATLRGQLNAIKSADITTALTGTTTKSSDITTLKSKLETIENL